MGKMGREENFISPGKEKHKGGKKKCPKGRRVCHQPRPEVKEKRFHINWPEDEWGEETVVPQMKKRKSLHQREKRD